MADAVSARFGERIGMGVGLNSGPVVVGSVGGGGRLEFTAIGDAVNVASRVERVTRDTHDRVLLTGAVRDLLERPEAWMLAGRGELPIKGKSDPVTLYAAAGLDIRISRAPSGLTTGA
jgi:adenylate cyclase